jgi:two-component system chemotaxis response regulator CheB
MTPARQPKAVVPGATSIVVVGASAGGVEALLRLVTGLSPRTTAAIAVVLHVSPAGTSVLPSILARRSPLPVVAPRLKEPLEPGVVYVAPPDHHLIVRRGALELSLGPRENGHRPSIDTTMRSAAEAYGPLAAGIVLSGSRDDGTAGLLEIQQAGGATAVQDPEEALYDSMPRSALQHVTVDAILSIDEIGAWIAALDHLAPVGDRPLRDLIPNDDRFTWPAIGSAARLACPDCGGVLFERSDGTLQKFRCSIGHAFSIESLLSEDAADVEQALWSTVRSLEDRAALVRGLSERSAGTGRPRAAGSFIEQALELEEQAKVIRGALERVAAAIAAPADEPVREGA